MLIKQLSNPSVLAVTLAEAKDYLKINGNSQDTFVTSCIKSAIDVVEGYLNRALINRNIVFIYNLADLIDPMNNFIDKIYFKKAPIQSITSYHYYDDAGTEYTKDSSNYELMSDDFLALYDEPAPFGSRNIGAVKITCVCGYGTTTDDIPFAIKQAILQLVALYYENRGACSEGVVEILNLIRGFKIYGV